MLSTMLDSHSDKEPDKTSGMMEKFYFTGKTPEHNLVGS